MKKKKINGFFAEFKEFISRGSVIDLAVGIIVGSSFTAIVNSLVSDIVMPFFGWITSGADLSQYRYVFAPSVGNAKESAINYGSFIQNIINFILIAFVVFVMVKAINTFRRKKDEEAPPPPPPDPQLELLAEIRDLLREKES